jgi:Flp pilus assembly protein TadD
MQAAFGLVFYLRKTLLPIGLYPGYLLDKKMDPLAPGFILCAFFILAMTTGLILMRHRWPWALSAWLCYAVTVSPLLGFVQSGLHIAADRYTYISCMPFAVLAGAGMQRIWVARQRERLAAAGWFSVLALVGASVMILSVMSFRQTRIWHNNFTFWNYIIKSDPNNYLAYNNRGVLLKERKKDLKGALEDYDTAIALYPEYAGAYYNRGLLHEERGDWADAIADYSSVIRLDPKHAQAYNNRGILRNRQGDLAGAMADLNEAIRLAPFSPEAYANRGMIRLAQNDLQGGVQDLAKALEVASVNWPSRKQVEKILANLSQRLKTQD